MLITPPKQNSCLRNSTNENAEAADYKPGKRKHSIKDTDHTISKRVCKDLKLPNGLQDEYRQDLIDKLPNPCQTNEYRSNLPHTLIRFMYQLELSMFCLVRKYMYKHKYSSLSLTFRISKIGKFNNIIFCYKQKSIYVQIESVDKYYTDSAIGYGRLFANGKQSLINDHFDNFVKYVIFKPCDVSNTIEYLVFFTNSDLDLTEEKKLKRRRFKNFYPFEFYNINMEKSDILKTFLFTNNNVPGRDFYQFSLDKRTKEELLNRLKFSPTIQDEIEKRNFSQEFIKEIKEAFLDKLVFAVNQPNREELNSIVKSEIAKNSKVRDNYIALKEQILCSLTVLERDKRYNSYISGMIYEFNLLISFLHSMFLHKYMFSLNFEGKRHDVSNDITVNYKNKITYIKVYTMTNSIDYDQLFPYKQQEKKNMFSVNKHFTLFTEELKGEVRYFIIYTNANLDITEENRLKKVKSKHFYPLKFNSIHVQKKKYKILRDCSFLDTNGFYQFDQEETTREELMKLLKLPPSLQKEKEEGRFSDENEKEMKEKFLHKLIFAVKQPNKEKLGTIIKNEIETDIESNKVPYNYDDLREIALRWLESREYGHITKEIMEKLLQDIKQNRFSYRKVQTADFETVKFAKCVVGSEETPAFYQFCDFLIKGDGKKCLQVMQKKEVTLTSMSSILTGVKANAPKPFKDLYDLWFDEQGNETQYLKTLKKEKLKLINMSSILNGAGVNASKAFKNLYDLLFDEQGNKTKYLQTLEKERVNLANVSNILSAAGANAVKAFIDLYDTWFDANGNKTLYLKTLEQKEINLSNISSILGGAGTNAAKIFKEMYDLWFDDKGDETQYLETLKKHGIKLSNISSILGGTGTNAPKTFTNLYNLWFDRKGNKTVYLEALEKEGVGVANITSILNKARVNTPKAFKDLYSLWFDETGNKTVYLKTLEKEGINIVNVSSMLTGSGVNAPKAFKDLYNLWFDENGNKTEYLRCIKEQGINICNMSNILHASGGNAAKAFKDLYDTLFDKQGRKTEYLETLEKEEISFSNVSTVLRGAGAKSAKAFKDLCDPIFNKQANQIDYLKTIKKWNFSISNMFSILSGSGLNAGKAFIDLYDAFFDKNGHKTPYLKHFTEKNDWEESFTPHCLSTILYTTGTKATDSFKKLHDVCFDDEGNRTKMLDDFYKAGFKPRDISRILWGASTRASSILKRWHCVFFNEEGEITELLDSFYKAGFRPRDICNILNRGIDRVQEFYDFCFIDETKEYLCHFINKEGSFSLINLCIILRGAGPNICKALKDFHDICFDESGKKSQILNDFYKVGFSSNNLSDILFTAGCNAAFIFRSFHKCCFNEENYLDHFLAQGNIFTPYRLSRILWGVGIKISFVFKKLHDLCFDNMGNKTNYLNDLIKKSSQELTNTLYVKVRKVPLFLSNTSV
nr:uncharacterized protein LOC116430936 isoform X1 [Nomia melanderi]